VSFQRSRFVSTLSGAEAVFLRGSEAGAVFILCKKIKKSSGIEEQNSAKKRQI